VRGAHGEPLDDVGHDEEELHVGDVFGRTAPEA
jgi:hypothetical protein